MEVDEIHTQACKLSRIGIGRNESNKIGKEPGEQYKDEDEEDGKINGGEGVGSESGRLRAWHSSRIFRVSRASGGKDRHSKVLTAKGLRDRRVRLSVSTAIQFYDLQDRLGYDQPSKAVEWLIKAASDSIAELPPLRTVFPDTPKQPSNEKRPRVSGPGFDPAEIELDPEPHYQTPQQQISLSKSAGSSTSETSKGSGLSLSRSEIRVKARERARERTAKEKESPVSHEHNVNPNSQNSSFTELLTGGNVDGNCHSPTGSAHQNPNGGLNFVHKPFPCPMDYYGANLLGHSWLRSHHSGFSGQTHFGNALPPQSMTAPAPFSVTGDHQPELQQFSFMPDHLIPVAAPAGSDYNHNFTISSSLAGFNRGTLQSNSQSPLPHLQRFSPFDGQNLPFFLGTAASGAAPVENHQFPAGFDSRLQLYYGDECRHSDLKGKGKN